MALASNAPDTEVVTNRLLRNATDFGHSFSFFYNPSIAEHFARLLRDHLTIAADGYEDAIKLFDEIEIQALIMSDMFLKGFVKQFPNQVIR